MKQMDPTRLVIVDEGGSNIALTPLYGWAPKGQRAHGSVPRTRGKNTTLLASLSLDFRRRLYDPGRIRQYTGL
jgi:hypothetical protein